MPAVVDDVVSPGIVLSPLPGTRVVAYRVAKPRDQAGPHPLTPSPNAGGGGTKEKAGLAGAGQASDHALPGRPDHLAASPSTRRAAAEGGESTGPPIAPPGPAAVTLAPGGAGISALFAAGASTGKSWVPGARPGAGGPG